MSNNRGIKRHIPNILTLLNLSCGFLAIYFIGIGEWVTVCILIGLAGIADLLDGLVARALNVSSPIGAQLDSLADMISFGLVPGIILFYKSIGGGEQVQTLNNTIGWGGDSLAWVLGLPAVLFPICAALRLARFNVEDDSVGDFIGLSTPAAAAVVIGYLLVPPFAFTGIPDIAIIAITLSLLMVSNITMFSLKFKGMGWNGNEIRYLFIVLFIVLLVLSPKEAIFVTMVLYILTNTILHFYRKLST